MDFKTYQELALRTEKPGMSEVDRWNHALLGMISETGEIASIIKAHIIYGKELDITHLKEELGDASWFFALCCKLGEFFPDKSPLRGGDPIECIYIMTEINADMTKDACDLAEINIYYDMLQSLAALYNIDWDDVLKSNIRKLAARYPEGYKDCDAILRDKGREKLALETEDAKALAEAGGLEL